jgi:hypothetical protein
MKKQKNRYFRGVLFKLECGHEKVQSTSMYRLDRRRLSCIIGSTNRTGLWCLECNALCQPTECKGTVRLNPDDPV